MASSQGAKVELDQYLFGYDEGHRLIAGSRKLPEEAASILLLQSDLVSGLSSSSFQSYWTGFPVVSLKSYALMHTWPAPEMPRPGCVWTQVVLIRFADMARVEDFGVLCKYFKVPREASEYDNYKQPIFVETPLYEKAIPHIDAGDCLQVLRAIYSPKAKGTFGVDKGGMENAIFAIWSQQWPRLRRSFSFRTARVMSEPVTSRIRFALRWGPIRESHFEEAGDASATEPWEIEALNDVLSGPAEFRRFLWRYGSDQLLGLVRFRFLAEIYVCSRAENLPRSSMVYVLEQVVKVLPKLGDGKLLKDDLVSAGRNKYSLFPLSDPLEILDFIARGADLGALPLPPSATFDAMHELWPEQSNRILLITECAIQQGSEIADQMLVHLAAIVAPAEVFAVSNKCFNVRLRLVESNPYLLDCPEVLLVPQLELNKLLRFIIEPELAARVVTRLVLLNDFDSAQLMMSRFPKVVEQCVLVAVTNYIRGDGPAISGLWLNIVKDIDSKSLAKRLLSYATTTNSLAACAVLLEYDLNAGLSASSIEWANKLIQVKDDVAGVNRQVLLTYLLSIALAQPIRGCEPLFERTFEVIHTELSSSLLPQAASDILVRVLPDLFFWEQWDICLRLRHGVVNAYTKASLDPKSFHRMVHDASLFNKLVQLAAETKSGRSFLEKIK